MGGKLRDSTDPFSTVEIAWHFPELIRAFKTLPFGEVFAWAAITNQNKGWKIYEDLS